jgi:hypothetical protein
MGNFRYLLFDQVRTKFIQDDERFVFPLQKDATSSTTSWIARSQTAALLATAMLAVSLTYRART